MSKQSVNIEQLFQVVRNNEPDLSDITFTSGVMRRVNKMSTVTSSAGKKQIVILWLAGLLGFVLAGSLFPVAEFIELLTVFSGGVTLPKVGFMTLVISALAFSGYWITETDSV
jgi:hypothetical protein